MRISKEQILDCVVRSTVGGSFHFVSTVGARGLTRRKGRAYRDAIARYSPKEELSEPITGVRSTLAAIPGKL